MNSSSSTFLGRTFTKNLRALKSFELDEEQKVISARLDARCTENCSFLYPINEDKLKICENECFEKHRDVLRLKNASKRALNVALFVFSLILVFSLYNYYITYWRK